MFQQNFETVDPGHPYSFGERGSIHTRGLVDVAADRNQVLEAFDCAECRCDIDRIPAPLPALVVLVRAFGEQKLRHFEFLVRDGVDERRFPIGIFYVKIHLWELLQKLQKTEVFIFDCDVGSRQLRVCLLAAIDSPWAFQGNPLGFIEMLAADRLDKLRTRRVVVHIFEKPGLLHKYALRVARKEITDKIGHALYIRKLREIFGFGVPTPQHAHEKYVNQRHLVWYHERTEL